MNLTETNAWAALQKDVAANQDFSLRAAFAADPDRARKMTIEAAGWTLDFSKNLVDDRTMADLYAIARECGLQEKIEAMFRGEHINETEDRAVLHTALRALSGGAVIDQGDGKDVMPGVREVLDKMAAFAEQVRSGAWRGLSGKPVRNVVNIGIGGSDLGPCMAAIALAPFSQRNLRLGFVSNVDATHFAETVRDMDP